MGLGSGRREIEGTDLLRAVRRGFPAIWHAGSLCVTPASPGINRGCGTSVSSPVCGTSCGSYIEWCSRPVSISDLCRRFFHCRKNDRVDAGTRFHEAKSLRIEHLVWAERLVVDCDISWLIQRQ